jgi:hypothetical protein
MWTAGRQNQKFASVAGAHLPVDAEENIAHALA